MTANLLKGNRYFIKELRALSKSLSSKDETTRSRINEAADRFEAMYRDFVKTRAGLDLAMEVMMMASKDDPDTKRLATSRLNLINERVPYADSLPCNNTHKKQSSFDDLQLSIFEGGL